MSKFGKTFAKLISSNDKSKTTQSQQSTSSSSANFNSNNDIDGETLKLNKVIF